MHPHTRATGHIHTHARAHTHTHANMKEHTHIKTHIHTVVAGAAVCRLPLQLSGAQKAKHIEAVVDGDHDDGVERCCHDALPWVGVGAASHVA